MDIAAPTYCHFLELARELRNMIYVYLTKDHMITTTNHYAPPTIPMADLLQGPCFNLLLVNHQVHSEYLESVATRLELKMTLSGWVRTAPPLKLRSDFNLAFLKHVRKVEITMYWVVMFLDHGVYRWVKEHSLEQLKGQVQMSWTPTEGTPPLLPFPRGHIADYFIRAP